MMIQEGGLFLKRIKNIILAFWYTFLGARGLRKLHKKNPKIAWNDPDVVKVCQSWGMRVSKVFGLEIHVEGEATKEPAIFIGNHISYLDIIGLYTIQHVCFVSKAEVGEWPIIGAATKAAGSILVNRESSSSRVATTNAISKAISEEGRCICIFPEGTTSIHGKNWRRGVFSVAKQTGCFLQPMGLSYDPIRRAAYIDDDNLLSHMFNLIRNQKMTMTVKFFPAFKIQNLEEDMQRVSQEVRQWADSKLEEQGYFESDVGYLE
jgi:1-acyl-sn-glycerol-3-phosphate acyltransferase